ncbi:putative hydrolase NIT3 [Wickerhamiella sorbophila]|uniref:Putative hydrolase NIT3 n=1 Tax=Wickerhamiella sorbophila TaxID=45607 RepID=A0A2T0FNE9_9ASCO|nr:putative hydrolase NIT3 [Wickerhamiella sorbophila]PRT56523.1 putative hydrolase NIT3 [Wickerhamiella sorbophila]
MLRQPLKVALVQLKVGADKAANLAHAKAKVSEAASHGAKLVVLPECWNSPYAVTAFPEYAEEVPTGETSEFLADLAKSTGVFLIGGSIPEKDGDKYYNTSVSYSPSGQLLGKHRKIHLFDIDVPGKIRFKESDILSPGNTETLIDLEGYGKVGLGICYDIRFPELAARAARRGAFAMIYPGAFNTTTGPLHWQLLARSRAVDNQVFVLVDSPARDMSSSYHAYGHSQAVDPWGAVLTEAAEDECIVYATLDPAAIADVRQSIPVSSQRRFDVYPDVSKK